MRRDPVGWVPPLADEKRSRVSASHLRGFRLLDQGIFPTAAMMSGSAQSIADATETKVRFNGVYHDTPASEAAHADAASADLANERLKARYQGLYLVTAYVQFDYDADGFRQLRVMSPGGGTIYGRENKNAIFNIAYQPPVTLNFSRLIFLDADAELELHVFHNAGNAVLLLAGEGSPHFGMAWVSL